MYEFIWRHLPGNWFVKTLISAVLIAAIVFVLMQYVFPIIAPYMPFNDATIEGQAAAVRDALGTAETANPASAANPATTASTLASEAAL